MQIKGKNIVDLNLKIDNYKNEIESMSKKIAFYRKNHEKYLAAKEFFLKQNDEDTMFDESFLSNSTKEIIIDLKYPSIKIKFYQFESLNTKQKYGEAIRFLMDILFEREVFFKKNSNFIKNQYPEKYEIIKNYIVKHYKCTVSQINKSITDKCHS